MKAIHNFSKDKIVFGKDYYDDFAFEIVMKCIDIESGKIIEAEAIKELVNLGTTTELAKRYIVDIENFVEKLIVKNEESLKETLNNFLLFNQNNRSMSYIFSMSSDYASDSMWAYYSCNNGFCIEYDYRKSTELSIDIKRKIVNTFKVIYKEGIDEHSFIGMLEYFLTGKENKLLLKKEIRELLTKLNTKKKIWQHEKEWRITLCNLDDDNKLYADLVSAIIIDEKGIDNENAKKLIELCYKKNWLIKIRKNNLTNTSHIFEQYKRSNK